jgi:hypothetical protein
MPLSEFHGRLAITALIFCGIMAVWGLFRFFLKRGVSSGYWGAVIVAEVVILGEGLLGIYLWFIGQRPERSIHWLYGAALALAMPLVYTATKGRQDRPEMLLYGVGFLVMFFLVLRAMVTGG